jgi:hypothetical protein
MFILILAVLERINPFAIVAFMYLVFMIVGGLPAPIIMLVAAKKLMSCSPRWPAYVIGGAAVYHLLMQIPQLMHSPIAENLAFRLPTETYLKIIRIASGVNWFVGLASAIAILTVCKRLASVAADGRKRADLPS